MRDPSATQLQVLEDLLLGYVLYETAPGAAVLSDGSSHRVVRVQTFHTLWSNGFIEIAPYMLAKKLRHPGRSGRIWIVTPAGSRAAINGLRDSFRRLLELFFEARARCEEPTQ